MNHSLRPWPIVIGLLVDTVGSGLFGLAYGIITVIRQGPGSGDADAIALTTTDSVLALVFGLLLVAAGGYVAARRAGIRPLAHSVCVGVGVLAITLILEAVVPDPSTPQWFTLISVLAVIPAGALGGLLASIGRLANKPLQPTSGGASQGEL